MTPAGAIDKLGFRRWYERQLYACHGWLVAGLVCVFALIALLGDLSVLKLGSESAIDLVAAFAAGLIAWHALWQYMSMLMQALHLSERSTCRGCGTHGRYRLVGATSRSMTVSCRKCEAEWTIE